VAKIKHHPCIETTIAEDHILLIIPSKICKIMDQKISEIKAIGKNEKKIINLSSGKRRNNINKKDVPRKYNRLRKYVKW
jgi:hypothetical protein